MRDDIRPCCEPEFWANLVISLSLVLFAGLTSGLSLGLLSHSKVDLEVLIKAGLPKDQKNAAKVLPVVKNECFLLCTLLIAKSLATERVVPSWCAILVSVIFVVAFVEVIPKAVCSRHGLSLGAKFTLFVRFLLFILSPVSYPVSKVLDWLLGKNCASILRRSELKTLVNLHGVKAGKGGDLTDDETTIISGALGMMGKTAIDAMTPLSRAFSLDINSNLNMDTMKIIASKGHSRIPIYSDHPENIVGLILVKNLIFYHPEDETPIKKLTIRRILRVYDNWPLYEVLKLFQEGNGHMAVVVKSERDEEETYQKASGDTKLQSITIHSDIEPKETNAEGHIPPINENELLEVSEIQSHSLDDVMKQDRVYQPWNRWEQVGGSISNEDLASLQNRFADEEVVGIITMEDVLEELLQEEILDETDQHVEIHDKRVTVFIKVQYDLNAVVNDLNLKNKKNKLIPRIRVKFVPSRRSSSVSQGTTSATWRTPRTSFSSYYHSPVKGSPSLSYVPSPLILPGPISRSASSIRSSILFHQLSSVSRHISRKSN